MQEFVNALVLQIIKRLPHTLVCKDVAFFPSEDNFSYVLYLSACTWFRMNFNIRHLCWTHTLNANAAGSIDAVVFCCADKAYILLKEDVFLSKISVYWTTTHRVLVLKCYFCTTGFTKLKCSVFFWESELNIILMAH